MLAEIPWDTIGRAAMVLLFGLLFARLARPAIKRLVARSFSGEKAMLAGRLTFYAIIGLTLASVLQQFHVDLSLLLGAAGLLTVALGFASQTSVSNIISGLFLVGEGTFQIGEVIQIGNTTGEVLEVDLLAIKLRTFDNLLVRIPNESLLKSEIINKSRFPIRRIDLLLGVAYKEDIDRVRQILTQVAERNPLCLDEPKPQFFFLGFGDSAIDLQFSVWCVQQRFLELKNQIHLDLKLAFDAAEIEIPFPHRTLYTGNVTEPFPIRVVGDAEKVVKDHGESEAAS